MNSVKREIKLKRALILGNFYNQQVQIVQLINGVQEEITDAVVGLKPQAVLTRSGGLIPRSSILSIYQM